MKHADFLETTSRSHTGAQTSASSTSGSSLSAARRHWPDARVFRPQLTIRDGEAVTELSPKGEANLNALSYIFWRTHSAKNEPVASFILTNASPSKAEIWAKLQWIAIHWKGSAQDSLLTARAAKLAAAMLNIQGVRETHAAISRAQPIVATVFGEHFQECFNRARAVLGPEDGVLDWPVLFTTH